MESFSGRGIDKLCELAGSKVADVEPKSYELPEVNLPETLDASMPSPAQDPSPHQQSLPNDHEKSNTRLVEVLPLGQIVPYKVTDTSTVPEEPKHCSH